MTTRKILVVTACVAGAALGGDITLFLLYPQNTGMLIMVFVALATVVLCMNGIRSIDRRLEQEYRDALHISPLALEGLIEQRTIVPSGRSVAKPWATIVPQPTVTKAKKKARPKTRYQIAKASARRGP